MSNSNVFSVYSKNEAVYSLYIPFISLSSQEHKDIAESYIVKEAEFFFRNILKIESPIESIPYFKTITWQDFNQVNMEYFYNTLFFDLGERNSSGELISKLKWGVTFDEEIAPKKVESLSPSFYGSCEEAILSYSAPHEDRPDRKYGFITINRKPIFYYLYFTLQEILDAIYKRF